jgi:predicted RNA-binding Zn ribbon-like protein
MSQSEAEFLFVGGQLSLDFVNSVVPAHDGAADALADFSRLVSWLQQAGALASAEAKAALASWERRPEAKQVVEHARRLRGALRAMVERLARGKPAGQAALDEINRVLAQEAGYSQLARDGDGYALRFQPARREALHLLAPIARAAAELLCDGDPERIRQCGNPVCGLYYYDTSKNRTRRWCSMAVCGNRMKASAFYHRSRKHKR